MILEDGLCDVQIRKGDDVREIARVQGSDPADPLPQPPDGYPRVSGAAADIGAHEVQKSDIVFYAEFETGCE